jgi:arylsulfatase A-like enzyme
LSKYLPKITRGNTKDNYVIITADHSEELEDKKKAGHHGGRLTHKLLHVPLIICGGELEQRIIDTKASLIDLVPTILDLLGIKKPEFYKGTSLLRKSKSEKVVAQGIFRGKMLQRKF